ncbi:major facilitator superfamily MFS_1 [Clostridium sp. DL-VIII]|uniref:MFS transporter n=1 Tax=Clostridium sp. DL-VIII TaxID=641107 RepID=UPI00023AF351|nr:MFS transporter [Clostridium sp. DL-VIII]EHI97723.1 major facilitator superfamily MFS_1 [Clostridium sp. DL-VIII]
MEELQRNDTLSSKKLISRMENFPVGKFHYKLLNINGAAWAFDAFDVGIVTFIVAALTKSWNLTTGQVSIFLSVGLFGMLFGASISGALADRFGRKSVFKVTMLLYSICSLICAIAPNYTFLLIARFFVGVGLGSETPIVTAILGEFIPASRRGKVQGLLDTFWAVGWLASAVIAYFVIPTVGWRWTFVIGAMPAFFVFVIRRHLPESPRWLISKGRIKEAEEIVNNIEETLITQGLSIPEVKIEQISDNKREVINKKSGIGLLFSNKYCKASVMLWGVWFFVFFGYYGLFSWMPSIFVKAGHSMVQSFFYVLIMQIAFVPNQFICAYLMDKIGRKTVLGTNLLLSALATIAYGLAFGSGVSSTIVVILGALTSYFVSGIFAVIYTYSPELYPTSVRATGVGAASAVSRVGSMLAPIVIGYGLTSVGITGVFAIVAVSFVLGAVFVWVLGTETKGVILED